MHRIHKTQTGQRLPISMMTDDHLKNTITLKLREVEATINSLNVLNTQVTPLASALYGIKPESISKAATARLPVILDNLYPYLAEAMLRGISFTDRLQEVMGRKGADIVPGYALPSTTRKLPGVSSNEPRSYGVSNTDLDEDPTWGPEDEH